MMDSPAEAGGEKSTEQEAEAGTQVQDQGTEPENDLYLLYVHASERLSKPIEGALIKPSAESMAWPAAVKQFLPGLDGVQGTVELVTARTRGGSGLELLAIFKSFSEERGDSSVGPAS
jgi:hypothetical protein